MNKFTNFLNSLETPDNSSLVEAISKGYNVIMLESWEGDVIYSGDKGTVEVEFEVKADKSLGEYISIDNPEVKQLLIDEEIDDIDTLDGLRFGFTGTAVITGDFSGSWSSASSDEPAGSPDWYPDEPEFDGVYLNILDSDLDISHQMQIGEGTKLFSILSSNFDNFIDYDKVEEEAFEDVSAPSDYRTTYFGPR